MKTFRLKDNSVKLNICGKSYRVEPAAAEAVILAAQKRILAFADTAAKGEAGPEDVREACGDVLTRLDEVLGTGAAADIFREREASLYDCIDLLAYVEQEIVAFAQTKNGKGQKETADKARRTAAQA